MELIKGIFTKFAEEPTYDHAMSVIDSLENNFTTNLPKEDFYKAFQLIVICYLNFKQWKIIPLKVIINGIMMS